MGAREYPRSLLAHAGLAVNVAAWVAVVAHLPSGVRLIAVLLGVCLSPGAAVVSHVRTDDAFVSAGLVICAGLSLSAGGAVVMAWTSSWQPLIGLHISTVLCAVSSAAHARRGRIPQTAQAARTRRVGDLHAEARPSGAVAAGSTRTTTLAGGVGTTMVAVPMIASGDLIATHRRVLMALRTLGPAWAPLPLALLIWAVVVGRTDLSGLGDYGLLAEVPPLFFLPPVLVISSFVVQLSRPRLRPLLLCAHVVVLIVLLHATLPALLTEPQYGWTYKHIGVIEYIRAHGSVAPQTDIYQQWPAFFALLAVVSDLAGVGPLRYAEWAPVAFNLLDVVMLGALCRTLFPAERRLPYGAAVVFLCCSWVGQDYLAPQAFALTLSLGVQLLMMRYLRRPVLASVRAASVVMRSQAWLRHDEVDRAPTTPQARAVAIVSICGAFAVLVASHQLTPYLVIGGTLALVVLGLVRPGYLAVILTAIAVLYLAPRWSFLTEHFQIFSGFDLSANTKNNVRGQGSGGSRLTSMVVRALSLSVWGAASLAILAHWRRFGRVAAPALLFLSPFSLVLGQSYGGEGVFRVYLATLPWASMLIALSILTVPAASAVRSVGRTLLLLAWLLACMQGLYGQLLVNRISPGEVEASEYLYRNALPDSVLVLASYTFPTRLGADYGRLMPPGRESDGNILETDRFDGRVLDASQLPEVQAVVDSYGARHAYFVISSAQVAFAHYFGLLPDGSVAALEQAMESSPDWTPIYRNQDAVIFRRDTPAAGASR